MKFAQEFRKALQREGNLVRPPAFLCQIETNIHSSAFPRAWVDCAIPYGQLKKCLKKVTRELEEIGLDKETLTRLAADQQGNAPVDPGFSYHLDVDGKVADAEFARFRPRLTVFIHLEDGIAVDAKLSPSTRDFLQKLALSNAATREGALSSASRLPVPSTMSPRSQAGTASNAIDIREVEVPLVFDAEFFGILQTDVSCMTASKQRNSTTTTVLLPCIHRQFRPASRM